MPEKKVMKFRTLLYKIILKIKYTQMKFIIPVIALCLLAGFSSCSKKESSAQKQDKKTETTQSTAKSFFAINEVDKSPSKGIVPSFGWDENGKKSTVKDFNGKVMFINLWATWCGPCKKEIPDLIAISNELKDKDFKMIGIQVMQQPSAQPLEDYLKTNPISYLILDGNTELVKAFETAIGKTIEGIPTTIIVDKGGKIVDTITGMLTKEQYLEKINKYL
jgi:thiol-disulfide isomerase/thioredoxin